MCPGRWVNDYALGLDVTPVEPLAIDGGSIKLTANGDLKLASGSLIRADGGAWLAQDNGLTEGKGGAISLETLPRGDNESSLLHLDGKLSAYGLSEGGSLSLASGDIIVGAADNAEQAASALVLGVHNGQFDFAKDSGFGAINLSANAGDLTVKADTTLTLVQQNRILQGDFRQQAGGRSLAGLSRIETLPEHLRNPVDLSLTAFKDVKLETGSKILGDKEATISLASTAGGLYVDGLIDAPAGSINLNINADPAVEYNAAQAIWLGEHGQLTALGTTRLNPPDASGRRTGEVLDGGDITLKAQRGYVILEQGSADRRFRYPRSTRSACC